MLSSIVVDFVNGDSRVHDVRLDCLLMDNRLDVLVDVMVDMFASNSWCCSLCMCCLSTGALVPELCSFLLEPLCYFILITMVVFTVLDSG